MNSHGGEDEGWGVSQTDVHQIFSKERLNTVTSHTIETQTETPQDYFCIICKAGIVYMELDGRIENKSE